jgi:hypothetical protein
MSVVLDTRVLGFNCVSNNSPASCAIGEEQLSVRIDKNGDGTNFTFFNVDQNLYDGDTIDPAVHEIYFDTPLLTGYQDILSYDPYVELKQSDSEQTKGVNYAFGKPNPRNLSAPTEVGFVSDFGIDTRQGNANGINEKGIDGIGNDDNGEWLTIFFKKIEVGIFFKALDRGELDIGLHVYSLGRNSESFVSEISQVPLPAAFWLFGTAMIGLAGLRKRSKEV